MVLVMQAVGVLVRPQQIPIMGGPQAQIVALTAVLTAAPTQLILIPATPIMGRMIATQAMFQLVLLIAVL